MWYRQWRGLTPEKGPRTIAKQDQPAGGRRKSILVILRRTWYRRLAGINRLIAEARQRMESQNAHISQLEHAKRSTSRACARLRQFEVILQLLEGQRGVILERVRRSPLPAHAIRHAWLRAVTLTDRSISRIVKAPIRKLAMAEAEAETSVEAFSGHTIRVGYATTAGAHDEPASVFSSASATRAPTRPARSRIATARAACISTRECFFDED
jgi:hypothetical protein